MNDWEPELIELWNQGVETEEIARRWGLPRGTVQSRAHRLQVQGKIQPRARGGNYPRQKAMARREGTAAPVQRPVQTSGTGAVSSVDTGAGQRFDTGAVQRLETLEQEVLGLRRLMQSVVDRLDRPPVQTPVQITTLPPYPKGKAVRWNLWILDAIKDQLSAQAAEWDMSPSELVQEYLWKALNDLPSSTPSPTPTR